MVVTNRPLNTISGLPYASDASLRPLTDLILCLWDDLELEPEGFPDSEELALGVSYRYSLLGIDTSPSSYRAFTSPATSLIICGLGLDIISEYENLLIDEKKV